MLEHSPFALALLDADRRFVASTHRLRTLVAIVLREYGHPDRVEGDAEALEDGVFVPKPFSPAALARRVGEVLDH